eukprot:5223955-Pyramimonas_sp.AAC.1
MHAANLLAEDCVEILEGSGDQKKPGAGFEVWRGALDRANAVSLCCRNNSRRRQKLLEVQTLERYRPPKGQRAKGLVRAMATRS